MYFYEAGERAGLDGTHTDLSWGPQNSDRGAGWVARKSEMGPAIGPDGRHIKLGAHGIGYFRDKLGPADGDWLGGMQDGGTWRADWMDMGGGNRNWESHGRHADLNWVRISDKSS